MKVSFLVPLALFAALAGLLYAGLERNPGVVSSPLVGRPLPAFALPGVQRGELRSDALGDSPSLLNVWASWCVACRAEHPLLLRLARSGEAPIYGLNYKDEREDAVQWLNRFGDPYRRSGHDRDGKVGLDLGVYGVPETFVIDREGRIAAQAHRTDRGRRLGGDDPPPPRPAPRGGGLAGKPLVPHLPRSGGPGRSARVRHLAAGSGTVRVAPPGGPAEFAPLGYYLMYFKLLSGYRV